MTAGGIRGITIEIGGDTSPLEKALKDINGTSSKLTSELKDVNRLLKFDPSNIVLAAQKQDILKESISATKEKLDKLKTAQEQVEAQFKRGDIGADEYRAFQREVVQTESKLNKLESELRETTNAEQAQTKETGQLTAHMNKLQDAAHRVAGAMGTGLKIGAGVAAAGIAAVAAGAVVAAGAIGKMINASVELADSVKTQADVYSVTTDRVQELTYAGKLLDVDAEVILNSQTKLTKAMYSASDGTGAQADAFKKLKVSLKDSNGNLRDAEDVQADVFNALKNTKDETLRDALAMTVLGKSAMELNPLIKAGGDRLKELSEEAHNMGAVVSEEALEALDNFGDNLEGLKVGFKGVAATLTANMMPAMTEFLGMTQNLLSSFAKAQKSGNWQPFLDDLNETLDVAISAIGEYLPKFLSAAGEIVNNLADGLIQYAPQLIDAAVNTVVSFVAFLTQPDTLERLIDAAIACISSLGNGIIESLYLIIPAIFQIITTIVQELAKPENTQRIVNTAIKLIQVLTDGLVQNLTPLVVGAVQIIESLTVELLKPENVQKILYCGWEIGKALVKGIADGITAAFTGKQLADSYDFALTEIQKNALSKTVKGLDYNGVYTFQVAKNPLAGQTTTYKTTSPAGQVSSVTQTDILAKLNKDLRGFDIGTRYLPNDMVIVAHKGEMIVPKEENPYANSRGDILPKSMLEQTKASGNTGIVINIEKFENNRKQDVEQFADELMYLFEEKRVSREKVFA